ncbi:hypothetical protein WN944_001143 [Citrus x changshan-huyou]|uniref:Uncharacterized protein n=1 Tax=Citrus x changshan-huyou TaxID=2935761 RepID=A0AAP0QUH9_9ROSI
MVHVDTDLDTQHESYLTTYSGLIHPIPDKASWLRADGDGILPPEASWKTKEEYEERN